MCVSQNAHIYNIILLLNSNNYFRLFLLFFVTISQFKTLFHDVEQFYVTSVESQNVKRQNRNLRFRPSFSSPIQLIKNPRCRKSNRYVACFKKSLAPKLSSFAIQRIDTTKIQGCFFILPHISHTRKPSPALPSPHRTET